MALFSYFTVVLLYRRSHSTLTHLITYCFLQHGQCGARASHCIYCATQIRVLRFLNRNHIEQMVIWQRRRAAATPARLLALRLTFHLFSLAAVQLFPASALCQKGQVLFQTFPQTLRLL